MGRKMETVKDYFVGLQNHCWWWLQSWHQKMTASWQESYDKPGQCAEKQRHHFASKGPYSQDYGLSIGHVWLWELDHKESRAPKNWCLPTVVLEKTPESPLDSKEIQPVNLKGNNSEGALEGLMSKLQYFGHRYERLTHCKRLRCWERLKAGRERDDQGWDGWMHHWLDGHV